MEFADANKDVKQTSHWLNSRYNTLHRILMSVSVWRLWQWHLGSCQATMTPVWMHKETLRSPVTHAHTLPGSCWMPSVFVCRNPSDASALLDSRILHLWVQMSDREREGLSHCSNLIGQRDYFILSINPICFQAVKECRRQAEGEYFLLTDRLSDEWVVKYLIKCANIL